jgi:4'-phosphopantetheinyl transferase
MDALTRLTSGEIHLWLAFYDKITSPQLQGAYRQLLAAAEREQELRFHFARDRHRYLVTRALVRTVLSQYARIEPEEWIFSTNSYGRPEIANVQAREARLSFNISHTQSLIVLAVTQGGALGVDVENFVAREAALDIAARYFAPDEVTALAAVAPSLQQYRFFEYWTFKESYIKARGMGLSLPLDQFSFHYPREDAVEITIDPRLADHPPRWQFWQFKPSPQHVVAVCAERVNDRSARLLVRQTVPLMSEELLVPTFLRTSG